MNSVTGGLLSQHLGRCRPTSPSSFSFQTLHSREANTHENGPPRAQANIVADTRGSLAVSLQHCSIVSGEWTEADVQVPGAKVLRLREQTKDLTMHL